jgi:5'(3')-deoxyribonucleotidase
MKMCFLDMDGTIVDFVKGALAAHNINLSVEDFYKDHLGEWDMAAVMGVSVPDFWSVLNKDFWANLPWMEDGQRLLEMLEGRFGRENMMLVTSPSLTEGLHEGKILWMKFHLPEHYSKPSGHIFTNRKHLLSNRDHILIDDNTDMVDRFISYRDGHACLVPRAWNKLHDLRDRAVETVAECIGVK